MNSWIAYLAGSPARFFRQVPLLPFTEDYWVRAGNLRARMIRLGHKPKLADTLMVQSCLDHGALLLSRYRDFRPFAKHVQLKLFPYLLNRTGGFRRTLE